MCIYENKYNEIHQKLLKKRGEEEEGLKKSNTDGMYLIKIHYIYIIETPLYN
jgi:hypothetical protein